MTVPNTQHLDVTPARAGVLAVARKMKLNGIFVEVGTYLADYASAIMENCNPKKLYCVDPYKNYEDFKDAINTVPMDKLFAEAKTRLSPYGSRVEFLRMMSTEAAARFADNSLDFVYIDGNHRYRYVMKDLELWYPKVKSGGLICGDDAVDDDDSERNDEGDVVRIWNRDEHGNPKMWGNYGVLKAFRDFCEPRGIRFERSDTQILIVKSEAAPT